MQRCAARTGDARHSHESDAAAVPAVRYPAGFEAREINYLIKGLCPECRAKVRG